VKLSAFLLLGLFAVQAADLKVIAPPGPPLVGPFSPGIFAGDFLYVSGQGARNDEGKFAETTEQQTADSLNNVRKVIEAAGLTMEHVVYMQVYMKDVTQYDRMNESWRKVFTKNPPARATLGVHRMPTDTPIEINAVAVRDLKMKRVVNPKSFTAASTISAGVLAGNRMYVSGLVGRDPKTGEIPSDPAAQVQLSLERVKETLAEAGLDFRHVAFVNPYLTDGVEMSVMNKVYAKHFEFGNTPARATIRVSGLPRGANIEFTMIAVRDLPQRRAVRPKNMEPSATASPCVWAGDTFYCSAKSGFIPGPNGGIYAQTVDHQVRQTMRNLLDGLEEAGLSFENVVATNVYVDNLDEFGTMNAAYAEYFKTTKPTRTTVAPLAPVERKPDNRGRWPKLEEVSLVAVK